MSDLPLTPPGDLYPELFRVLGYISSEHHLPWLQIQHTRSPSGTTLLDQRKFVLLWKQMCEKLPLCQYSRIAHWVFGVDDDGAKTNVYLLFQFDRVSEYINTILSDIVSALFNTSLTYVDRSLSKHQLWAVGLTEIRIGVACIVSVYQDVIVSQYITECMPEKSRKLKVQYHLFRVLTGFLRAMHFLAVGSTVATTKERSEHRKKAMDDLECCLALLDDSIKGDYPELHQLLLQSIQIERLLCKAEHAMDGCDSDLCLALYRLAAGEFHWDPHETARKLDLLEADNDRKGPLFRSDVKVELNPDAMEPRSLLTKSQRTEAYSQGLRFDSQKKVFQEVILN
jgi:hypothetical protein